MFRFNVKTDVRGIPRRVNGMTKQGQHALINQVHADMNPYVPMLKGDLRGQSTMTMDAKSIIYNVPYARRQFYIPHYNYTTPGTGARWDLKAKAIHGGSWPRIAKRAMK